MKKNDESEFAIRKETGEIYVLNKQERILTTEILRMTMATKTGREFLIERFGKEGIKTAVGLLEEMGVQVGRQQQERQKLVS
jgi:hypothetical protein